MLAAASAVTMAVTAAPRPRRPAPARTPEPVQAANSPEVPATLDAPVAGPEPVGAGLWVRVLGPVRVERDGKVLDLTARQVELVAYLACHREGVGEDRVRAALWGDRPSTRGTFNNLVSNTRRQLCTVDGEQALPPLGPDRRYRLHPKLRCDLALLDEAANDAGAALLLAAVRGTPFDVPRGFGWADREGLTHAAATAVGTAAHGLASHHLAASRPSEALQAARQGLLAAPGDERLFGDRMLAHAALGDPAAVERVMIELLAVLDVDDRDDPREVLHPTTLAIYRRSGRGTALRSRRVN